MNKAFPMVTLAISLAAADQTQASNAELRRALTFHASFDKSADADFARGDAKIYHAENMNHPRVGKPGLHPGGVVSIAPGAGKFGSALLFQTNATPILFFQAARNLDYRSNSFQGTVSFWLNLSPDTDLAPGYCDPIQITPRQWDDGAFFIEFTKDDRPRHLRLGLYPDVKVWNPNGRPWDQMAFAEKPLAKVEFPPFKKGQWTHIVFTFENFNSGKPDGIAHLYLNGRPQGMLGPRQQTYTWDPSKTLIMLGLSYIGLYDELSLFDQPLTPAQVLELNHLPKGVTALLK